MNNSDRLFFIAIIMIVVAMAIVIPIAIITAQKKTGQYQEVVQSKPDLVITLPLGTRNLSAQSICTSFKAQAWNTPSYGNMTSNSSGVAIFCKNATKTFEIDYVSTLGTGGFPVTANVQPANGYHD